MLERLRLQEVSEIIFTVPEGVNIAGSDLKAGEPVMMINKPALSKLDFRTSEKHSQDGRGFISASGQTKRLEFVINEGSILYTVWSYLHGTITEQTSARLKGSEYVKPEDGILTLDIMGAEAKPENLLVYRKIDNNLQKLQFGIDYSSFYNQETEKYTVKLNSVDDNEYLLIYDYIIQDVMQTKVKQIHNNIFCAMDIYIDAMNMDTDEPCKVCIHCNRAQIFMDLSIGINNSSKASFTPIYVYSIPEGNELNKDVATITVI